MLSSRIIKHATMGLRADDPVAPIIIKALQNESSRSSIGYFTKGLRNLVLQNLGTSDPEQKKLFDLAAKTVTDHIKKLKTNSSNSATPFNLGKDIVGNAGNVVPEIAKGIGVGLATVGVGTFLTDREKGSGFSLDKAIMLKKIITGEFSFKRASSHLSW